MDMVWTWLIKHKGDNGSMHMAVQSQSFPKLEHMKQTWQEARWHDTLQVHSSTCKVGKQALNFDLLLKGMVKAKKTPTYS